MLCTLASYTKDYCVRITLSEINKFTGPHKFVRFDLENGKISGMYTHLSLPYINVDVATICVKSIAKSINDRETFRRECLTRWRDSFRDRYRWSRAGNFGGIGGPVIEYR